MNANDALALRFARQVIKLTADEHERTKWVERHVPMELHNRVWHFINIDYAAKYVEAGGDIERIAESHRGEVLRMGR